MKKAIAIFLAMAMVLALASSVFAHGVFLYVSDMHGQVGQEITVQVGWGYIFLGHDGSAITADAPLRRVFLIAPDGTETALEYSIFHQYYGRDYPENPINEITPEQLGTDEFPTGGRNLTYIEATFTPQTEGYYQVFFHRERNVPQDGGNEGRFINDIVKTYILVGNAAPEAEAGHGRVSNINRTEIMPVSDAGRLTPGANFEGYVLFDGQPAAEQEVRLELDAHEYEDFTTDAQGRFNITLPETPGEYAIRVVQDWEESGTAHQDFTSRRDVHILQIAITDDPPAVDEPHTEAEPEIADEIPPPADEPDEPAEAEPPVAPPEEVPPTGEMPPLFNPGHYAAFLLGGLLLLAAGLLIGYGAAKRKK